MHRITPILIAIIALPLLAGCANENGHTFLQARAAGLTNALPSTTTSIRDNPAETHRITVLFCIEYDMIWRPDLAGCREVTELQHTVAAMVASDGMPDPICNWYPPPEANGADGYEWQRSRHPERLSLDRMCDIVGGLWPAQEWDTAICIAWHESRFDQRAAPRANRNGTVDRGLFQLNSVHSGNFDWSRVFDPDINARYAYRLWQERGWQPWVAHRSCSGA